MVTVSLQVTKFSELIIVQETILIAFTLFVSGLVYFSITLAGVYSVLVSPCDWFRLHEYRSLNLTWPINSCSLQLRNSEDIYVESHIANSLLWNFVILELIV